MSNYRYDPTAMVRRESLAKMRRDIRAHLGEVERAIDACERQADGLRRAGGMREDHAAALLANLQPSLTALATLATDIADHIDEMAANPWREDDAR